MFTKENYIIFGMMFWKMRYWLVPCIFILLLCAIVESIEAHINKKKRKKSA